MTAAKHFPPVTFLRECFEYFPETGQFRWKRRPTHHFVSPRGHAAWNARFAGAPAFDHTTSHGYSASNLKYGDSKFQILASRAAWAIVTGEHPKERIDHRDNDPGNTRFANLREATNSQNNGNRRGRADKLKGAFWDAEQGRYRAIITARGVRQNLGRFDTAEQAHAAYVAAANAAFGEFARAA